MIVYVESNFILEIAHLREEHENCDRILNLSVTGEINWSCLPSALAKSTRLRLGEPSAEPNSTVN